MSRFKVGDIVVGVNKRAEVPRQGAVIDRVIGPKYYYISHVKGGGIGNRDERELKKG